MKCILREEIWKTLLTLQVHFDVFRLYPDKKKIHKIIGIHFKIFSFDLSLKLQFKLLKDMKENFSILKEFLKVKFSVITKKFLQH